MRRSIPHSLLLGLSLLIVAAPGSGAPSRALDRVAILLTAPSPSFETAPGGAGVIPVIEGFGHSSRPGEPMLPLRVLLVAIPEGIDPELRILGARSEPLPAGAIAPYPRRVVRDRQGRPEGDPFENVFSADGRAYGRDEEYPAAPVQLGAIGYLREQRFVEVFHTPIVHNPKSGRSRYFPEVRAELIFMAPDGGLVAVEPRPFSPDPLFEESYRSSLINYEQGKQFRTGAAAGAPTTSAMATSAAVATGPRYKLQVSRPGIYRLDYAYVQMNAPEILALDPRTLTLSAEGVVLPFSVRDAGGGAGDADGRFDPGDVLEFYGLPKTEPAIVRNYDSPTLMPDIYQPNDFTDTQIYWLAGDDPLGVSGRIPDAGGAPSASFPLAPHFEEIAVWEETNPSGIIYVGTEPVDPLLDPTRDVDPFFSIPSLLAGSTQAQRDLSLPLPGLAAATGTAQISVRLLGGSSLAEVSPDHRVRAWINNDTADAAETTWDGETIRELQFPVPHTVLTNPATLHLSAPGLAGVSIDRSYIDVATLRYRRAFNAVGDFLTFRYPNQDARFQVSGFSGAGPTIYEITRTVAGSTEVAPTRITGAVVSGGGPSTFTFEVARDASPAAPAVRTFVVAGPGGLLRPDAVSRAADPVLRDPQTAADIVVIGARDTVDVSPSGALQALLDHRLSAQGLTSKVVFIDQVYDEFSFGLRDANAIRSFLGYAFDNWRGPGGTAAPPSFVLLVGDATPDYKNTMQRPGYVDQVPTPIMFSRNSTLGYYSSDNWLAAFRGADQVPDIHLGRISTRTPVASAGVFDKIRRYGQSPPPGAWKGRAILVAGEGKNIPEEEGFEALQTELAGKYFSLAPYSTPDPPLYFGRPEWQTQGATAFRNALITELQNGAAVLSYIGHGGFDLWAAFSTIFSTADAETLQNDGPVPFLVTVNCLTGGFHFLGDSQAIGEAMTNNPSGGSIATLAPSGLSSLFVGRPVNDYLFATLQGPPRERLVGVAADGLRTAFWARGSVLDLQGYTLLGDPAVLLATPAPPALAGLTATPGNGEVILSWSAPAQPIAGRRIYRYTLPSTGGDPRTVCDPAAALTCSVSAPYSAVACDPLSTTSCADRSVVNTTRYYYYAVALDTEGYEGRASNFNTDCDAGPDCVTARPVNPGPPSTPTGLVATDPGSGGRLLVAWSPNPEPDLKNYSLYYGTLGENPSKVSIPGGSTSTTLVGLQDGVRYYLSLSATNTSGNESGRSAEIAAVPHLILGIAPPRAIDDLLLTPAGADLTLGWSRPTVDIYGRPTTVASYRVYRGPTAGFLPSATTLLATLTDPSVTTYTDPGAALPAAGNFFYLVTATDLNGFVSGAGHDLPNGIYDLGVTIPAAGMVRLSWPAVTTDVAGFPTVIDRYQVHMSGSPLPRATLGPATLVLDNVRTLSVDLSAPAAPLYFSVIAVDNRGNLSPF